MHISKVLVANRGEIAVRVIRAAKDAGIQTVAVYADQDRNARHTRLAHEAYALNGQTSGDTYLVSDKLIAIAKRSEANAIHPGYGFLSENAEFAEAVADAGLIWIGPPPEAIRLLGDKVSARKIARDVGAPLVPGTPEPAKSFTEIEQFVEEHGLPIAIKAAYGGGGRGLRVVWDKEELGTAFESATREAITAFGRGECFVEKFIVKPRHVETQCLADSAGNVVVISTRDCSLQRRHQKLVEEAPAPFLTSAQESELYTASKEILARAGYVGAGTCEFLIGSDGTISFLEVNTRLQVEHPVSEEVTGIDLVQEQFRLAEGGLLEYPDPQPRGHSIEFRINGEDPGRNFMPMPGPIESYRVPGGPGVRVDSGVSTGDVISGAFDSLLAKLIVTGPDRTAALERARRALAEFEITGLPTVIPFHRALLEQPAFCSETKKSFAVHTTWIENDFPIEIDPWSGAIQEDIEELEPYRTVVVEVEGRRLKVGVPAAIFSVDPSKRVSKPPRRRPAGLRDEADGAGIVAAPMQATVIKIAVSVGDSVVKGETLCVLEAMKMEQPMKAPCDGFISSVNVSVGDSVPSGSLLMVVSQDSNPREDDSSN